MFLEAPCSLQNKNKLMLYTCDIFLSRQSDTVQWELTRVNKGVRYAPYILMTFDYIVPPINYLRFT